MASHTLNPALLIEKAPAPRSATGDKPYEEYDSTVNDIDAAPVLASVLPTTGTASVDLPLRISAKPHTPTRPHIKQEHEEVFQPLQETATERNGAEKQTLPLMTVKQLRAVIAEKDTKVAELEQRLADQGKELEELNSVIRELEDAIELARSALEKVRNKHARS
ncbi:hypothetical protein J4E85_009810 [Alternaria conjuncta]|uniref:uncharacterized protein n=1 Tax=Alternaria conjuncta TaxID=181017 RepID=UPI002220EC79|nr:uncharacterized protein J4E85_009810 [Alternaria conjuncta]KAI4917718.1 hypothetical protein J4E85_009810 [Alternaria conjuncta]